MVFRPIEAKRDRMSLAGPQRLLNNRYTAVLALGAKRGSVTGLVMQRGLAIAADRKTCQ